jgi:multiple sugar transport system ATP-binding protein
MPSIRLVGVNKVFGRGVVAVRDLTLDVPDGECLALVGPSGCGKTTTLRLAAGLESPTNGSIFFGEHLMNRVHPRDRDVAMVFQNAALYPHMTAFKNMAFPLKIRKSSREHVDAAVRETARRLGILEALDRRPHELSGGQQQRVALGKAIVRRPQCFLFDEPLANVDPQTRLVLRALIKSLLRELRITTIHVTHDHDEAMALGNRIAVMNAGAVHQVGPPMQVYRQPADRFVAAFLGSPPMNFLTGTLKDDGAAAMFSDDAGVRMRLGPMTAQLVQYAGKQVVLGVRPHHLFETPSAHSAPLAIDVDVVEPLGDSLHVHGRTDRGEQIVAKLSAASRDDISTQRLTLHMNPATAYLFEAGEFGRNLMA